MAGDDELHDDYVDERKLNYEAEKESYKAYEKTVTSLSAAFLAFSLSFLALLPHESSGGATLRYPLLLAASWLLFATSVASMLVAIFAGAMSARRRTAEEEQIADGCVPTRWSDDLVGAGLFLYVLSGLAFVAGLATLVGFCSVNLRIL